jgi:CheY-like chemotaxis protein
MSRRTVLIVDDNENDREIYGKMLHYNGFDVLYAENGEEGIRILEEQEPDLIVLDMLMPELSGLAFCTLVRRKLELDVPILVLTAFRAEDLKEDAVRAGCTSYMEKPAPPYEVVKEVSRLIGAPSA